MRGSSCSQLVFFIMKQTGVQSVGPSPGSDGPLSGSSENVTWVSNHVKLSIDGAGQHSLEHPELVLTWLGSLVTTPGLYLNIAQRRVVGADAGPVRARRFPLGGVDNSISQASIGAPWGLSCRSSAPSSSCHSVLDTVVVHHPLTTFCNRIIYQIIQTIRQDKSLPSRLIRWRFLSPESPNMSIF